MLRKFLLKQKNNTGVEINKYEKIEKARFYLDQEAIELEQMMLVFTAAKDEIDEFIKKKINLKLIQPSGVTKFLQNIVRDAKSQTVYTSSVLETEHNVLDNREIHLKDENLIDELKQEIITVIDHGQKKVLKQIMKPLKKRTSMFSSNYIDKEIQVCI